MPRAKEIKHKLSLGRISAIFSISSSSKKIKTKRKLKMSKMKRLSSMIKLKISLMEKSKQFSKQLMRNKKSTPKCLRKRSRTSSRNS